MPLLKSTLFSLLFLCAVLQAFSQTSDAPALTSAVPPSPAAASLGKFADIPVGLYTGTPQVSVPLWEVKEGGLSLPVSLSYHAGGIKVEEIASWVGLGWALNAGGVITRTVRGLPDDGPNGIFSKFSPVGQATYDPTNANDYDKFRRYADGQDDSQADLFFFNFAGRTGKFVMDDDKNVHLLPHQRIKFEPTIPTGVSTEIRQWTVTVEDGTKYTFREEHLERSKIGSSCVGSYQWPRSAVSSWYLSEIQAAGGAKVSFEYITYFYADLTISTSETQYYKQIGNLAKPNIRCETKMDLEEGKRLKKIIFSGGEIEFMANAKRADLVHEPMLEEVVVRNQQGKDVKRFVLGHGYLSGTNIVDATAYPVPTVSDPSARLMLTEVTETGYEGAKLIQKPPYRFTYQTIANGRGLPSRLSADQDHWGFFNGKYNNSVLVPKTTSYNPYERKTIELPGAVRDVDPASTQVGTLTKIVYPTGGYTSFDYEQNDCQSTLLHRNHKREFKSHQSTNSGTVIYDITSFSSYGLYVNISYLNFDSSKGTFEIFKVLEDGSLAEKPEYTSLGQSTASLSVFFYNGRYASRLTNLSGTATSSNSYVMQLEWYNELEDPNKWVGGLRVRKITDYDPVSSKSTSRWYEYKYRNGLSSGSVIGVPEYTYNYQEAAYSSDGLGSTTNSEFLVRTSNSNTPLGTTQGSNVGYEQVTVLYGEGGANGKSTYVYTSPKQYPDMYDSGSGSSNSSRLKFPFAPSDSRDWLRGLIRSVTEYRNQDGQFYPVSRTENTYNFYEDIIVDNQPSALGVKVGYRQRHVNAYHMLAVAFFRIRSGYHNLASNKVTSFDQDTTKKVAKLTTYTYSPDHLQLLTSTEWTSESDRVITTSLAYPPDYADQSGFIKEMADANILVPIEKVVYEEDASRVNQRILSGQVSTYKAGGRGLLDELWVLESPIPVPLSAFKFSNTGKGLLPGAGTKTAFGRDPLYKRRIVYGKYDAKGNVSEHAMEDGSLVSYLWGYNKMLPVAEFRNASYAAVEAALGGAAAVEALANSTVLSQAQLNQLNGLRALLPKATVTVYTYDPLVGVKSVTDPNGRPAYYEYDGLGRLKLVKDEKGNVLQAYNYNYRK